MRLLSLDILDLEENTLRFLAVVGAGLPENYERIVHLPQNGHDERLAFWKTGEVIRIVNEPGQIISPEILERFGQKGDFSFMGMVLAVEGNQIGNLGLVTDGVNQYTDEHARLLRLLLEPLTIAMSNALEH
jgi:hypothetical protein